MKNASCYCVHSYVVGFGKSSHIYVLRVNFSWIYGFEHFVLNIFQITKPQYTISCTKLQGKTIQKSEKLSPSKYLVYTVAS